MSKCEIKLELERHRVRQGEPLRGRVVVVVDKDVHCKGLVLESSWKTHGRGDRDKGKGPKRTLFRGTWHAGELHAYPFELPSAAGPCTYHGSLINVVWSLRARADIPWAFDPKSDVDFVLAPGPVREYWAGPSWTPPRAGKTRTYVGRVVAALFIGLGVPLFLWTSHLPSMHKVVWPSMALAVALILLYPSIRSFLAEFKIGKPRIQVQTPRVDPGGTFRMRFMLRPRKGFALNGAAVRITGTETAQYRRGTRRYVDRNRFYDQRVPVDVNLGALMAGRPTRGTVAIDLPPDVALSFAARNNSVSWAAELHLDVPAWPDWKTAFLFAVAPGPGFSHRDPSSEAAPAAKEDPSTPPTPRAVAPNPPAVDPAPKTGPDPLSDLFDDPFEDVDS